MKNAALYAVPAALVEVASGIGSPDGNTKLSKVILEEIGEEIAQDVISGSADKATVNPQLPVLSTRENAVVNPINLAKTAIMTAPIVSVAGGINAGYNIIAKKSYDNHDNFTDRSKSRNLDSSNTLGTNKDLTESNSSNYKYETLINKPDIKVPEILTEVPKNKEGKLDRKSIITQAIQNVRSKNNPQNTETNSYVYVKDIGNNVLVNNDGLRHGLTRNAKATAQVTLNIGDLLENSIIINELNPRGNSNGGYVLLGVGTDADGNYYPTRMVINQFQLNDVEVLDVIYGINAKKKNQSPNGAGMLENSSSLIKGSSTMSVADLIDIVKDYFPDVLPQDVLDTIGKNRPNSTLSNSVKYSYNYHNQNRNSDGGNVETMNKHNKGESVFDIIAYTAGTVIQSVKNNELKNKFGFNPASSGNSVYYYDGNLLSQGNKELTPINAQNQMPITKGKQINGIEASEAVNKHNQMKKSVSMEQKKILNFASKFAKLNIIVSNVDLSSAMNLEGINTKNALACYDPSTNSIILNLNKINSENELLEAVLLREMTHSAESSNHYGELAEFVINSGFGDLNIPQNQAEFNKTLENKINDYYIASEKTVKLTPEGAKRELVEEYLAEILKNPDGSFYALQELARRDISTAKGILNTLKENFKRIKMKFTDISGYYTKYVNLSQYDKALDLFEKAVKDASKSRNATDQNIGFVIKESKEQGKVAFLDGKNIPRQKGESTPHAIRRFFNDNFKGHQITIDSTKDKVIMDQIGKYIYPGKEVELKSEKNKAAGIIDEIINIADNKTWNKNLLDKDGNIKKHGGLDCSGGFNYYDTKFAVDDSGLIYGGTIIARINREGKIFFYDLDNIREVGYQDQNEFSPVSSPLFSFTKETTSLKENIPQNTPVVNGNNSGNLTNNTQNDFTDYSDYRNPDNGNVGLLDRDTETIDNKNGAVDNNSIEFRTKKAEDYYKKAVNTLRKSLSKTFNITNLRNDTRVNEIIKAITDKHIKNGKVDVKDIDALFEEMYSKGKVINDELYKEYADLRKYLRNTRMFISKEDASNIADYSDFVKQNMGSFFVSTTKKDGNTEVEAVYNELMEQYPHLFSSEITHPADMLKRIAEVSRSIKKVETELSSYTGEEAEIYKEAAKQDFYNAVSAFSDKLNELYKYEKGGKVPVAEVPDVNWQMESTQYRRDVVREGMSDKERYDILFDKKIKDVPKVNSEKLQLVTQKLSTPISESYNIKETDRKKLFVKIGEEFGVFKDYTNKDIELDFKFSKGGMRESEQHQKGNYETFAKLFSCFDEVIDRAIGIEVHNRNNEGYKVDDSLEEMYVLVSAFEDGENIVPVKLEIKEFSNKDNVLYLAIALESIKKNEVVKAEFANKSTTDTSRSFDLSLAQLLQKVNLKDTDFTKYIPKDFFDKTAYNEDDLIGLYNERKELQEKYKKAEDGILLSDKDKHFLDGLVSGKITEADIHPSANIDGIKAVYDLKAQLDFVERSIARYNAIRKEKLNATANSLIEGSDNWKEKRSGLAYGRETMERNIRDMVKDKASADAIIDEYFTPVHKNEADRTKFKTEFRNRVRALGISRVIKKGDMVSESYAVQFLGELNGDIDYLENKSRLTQTDRIKLEELKSQKERFLSDNDNIRRNIDKINNAINEFHKIYDELFVEMNRVRVRNGYAPVEYRHTYFPHFINDEADGILDKMARAIGINMDVTELPTNLAGKTHTFKPGIAYFKNTNQRLGNKTVFDAVEGFDKYIEGISDVIYHTDDIQRLRVFENTLVTKYTEDGVKAEIEQLEENNTLDKETLQERYNALKERDLTKFGQFAIELREYTNLLANKKSMHDRHWEGLINRKWYNIATALNRNVSVNMIAGNLSSAFTNFIPLTQAMAGCSKRSIIKAGVETLRSYASDDGIIDMSDFLTNRFGSNKLVKTKSEKFSDILMKPMEFVDNFTSQVVWRAKYLECIDKNMGIERAVSEANSFAAGLLADRSKGALPTIFSAKNPIAKCLTAFQVEVNNQYSFLFKDLPNATRKKRELAAALMWYFLSAYLFNDLYEKIMGRRPAFDPVGMANDFVGYTTGYKLPNSFEAAGSLLKGNKVDFHTNKSKTQGGAAMHLAKDVAENLPFVGGLLGGGRIPVSSGIPYAEDLTSLEFSKITETISPKTPLNRRLKVIGEEASKLAYGLWPYGGASQILKTLKGVDTVRSGGKYTYNKKGEKSLQYPVHNDSTGETVKNYVQAGLFGRNALPTAQDWVNNEFDTLSVKDTERYDLLKEDGIKSKRSYDLVREIAALPNAKYSDQYKHIDNSGILPKAKTDLKISYLNKDTKEKLDVARRFDISDAAFVEHHYKFNYENVYNKLSEIDQKALSHLKDKKSSAIVQRAYIAKNKALTPEQKLQLDKLLISEDTKMKAEDYQSMDYFYYSLLTDSQKKRFPAAQKVFDYDARNYYYFLKCTSGVEGKNQKAKKLAKLREAGFGTNEALIWYELVLK